MKYILKEFCRRGIAACGLGPLALAIIYLFLQHNRVVEVLTVNDVALVYFLYLRLLLLQGA